MKGIHLRPLQSDSVYSRALLFNMLFAIAVTVIPLMLLTEYFINQYDQQINRYTMQMARQTQNYIDDTILEKIVDIPNLYFSEIDSNSQLTEPYYHDISNDSVTVQEISTRLKNITGTYSFISGMNLYYPQSHVMFGLSGASFVNDSGFFKSIMGHEQIVQQMLDADQPTQWLTSVALLGQETPSPAVFLKILPYSASGADRKAILAVGLDPDSFYEFIQRIQFSQDEDLMIIDPNGTIVLSTDRRQNGQVVKDKKLMQKIAASRDSGMIRSVFDKNQSIIAYQKSRYNDWRYVSITSVSRYYQKSTQIRLLILVALLLLLPLNLFFSSLVTKKAYRPLAQVLGRIRSMVSGESAESNEYHFLENTFRELSSQVRQLNGTLEENQSLIRHNALLKLLQGNVEASTEDERAIGNIRLPGRHLCCCIIRLFFRTDPGLEDRLLLEYNLVPVLEKLTGFSVMSLLDDQNRLVGIFSYENREREDVLEAVSQCIASTLKIPYAVCAGGQKECAYAHIRESYDEAIQTYQYAFVRCNERILRIEDVRQPAGTQIFKPRSVRQWSDYLRAGDAKAACGLLAKSVADFSGGSYGIEFIRYTLISFVTSIRMLVVEYGWDEKELFGEDLLEGFARQETICGFETWCRQLVARVAQQLKRPQPASAGAPDMSEKIRRYIQQNLCHDISLESVARALYISPGYLSRVFKSDFGVSFTEYLINLKMEQAVVLLRENKKTVKEIANELGYQSVHYFIHIFKEKYGATPKAYQQAIVKP